MNMKMSSVWLLHIQSIATFPLVRCDVPKTTTSVDINPPFTGKGYIRGEHGPYVGKTLRNSDYRLRTTLDGHTDFISSVAFSPDGKMLASGDNDGHLKIWDIASGSLKQSIMAHDYVGTVVFDPNGITVITGGYVNGSQEIDEWNLVDGTLQESTISGHDDIISSIIIHNNGNRMYSASDDTTIKIWDRKNNGRWILNKTLEGHSNYIMSLALYENGSVLISGDYDGKIILWDMLSGGDQLCNITLSREIGVFTSFVLSTDGKYLILGGGKDDRGIISLWDIKKSYSRSQTFIAHNSWVFSLAVSPDGHNLVSGSDDGTIKIWDMSNDMALTQTLTDHNDKLASLAYSRDGKTLVSGSFDKTIKLWDAPNVPSSPRSMVLMGVVAFIITTGALVGMWAIVYPSYSHIHYTSLQSQDDIELV